MTEHTAPESTSISRGTSVDAYFHSHGWLLTRQHEHVVNVRSSILVVAPFSVWKVGFSRSASCSLPPACSYYVPSLLAEVAMHINEWATAWRTCTLAAETSACNPRRTSLLLGTLLGCHWRKDLRNTWVETLPAHAANFRRCGTAANLLGCRCADSIAMAFSRGVSSGSTSN